MKGLEVQSRNEVNIVGKLLSTTFREGTIQSTGKPYESCNYIVRVTQEIEGKEEIHEIPLSVFATKYTNSGKINPAFKTVQDMKQMCTIQNDGEDKATIVRINKATISENIFIPQSGQLIDSWQLRSSFVNEGGMGEFARFTVEIFILDMHDEVTAEGETTGRLVIRGGIVQYGEKLDVVDFIVEGANAVEYISHNWEPNMTVVAAGRIRFTPQETVSATTDSWGEEVMESGGPKMARELIITGGPSELPDEDFMYDPVEIKKGFNVRKANIEQMQLNAKSGGQKKQAQPAPRQKFDWE